MIVAANIISSLFDSELTAPEGVLLAAFFAGFVGWVQRRSDAKTKLALDLADANRKADLELAVEQRKSELEATIGIPNGRGNVVQMIERSLRNQEGLAATVASMAVQNAHDHAAVRDRLDKVAEIAEQHTTQIADVHHLVAAQADAHLLVLARLESLERRPAS